MGLAASFMAILAVLYQQNCFNTISYQPVGGGHSSVMQCSGGWGGGQLSWKMRYGGVIFNVIGVMRERVGVQCPEKSVT